MGLLTLGYLLYRTITATGDNTTQPRSPSGTSPPSFHNQQGTEYSAPVTAGVAVAGALRLVIKPSQPVQAALLAQKIGRFNLGQPNYL